MIDHRRKAPLSLIILFGLFILPCYGNELPYHVTIACDSLGKKKEQCVASVRAWEKKTGKRALVVEAPTGSSNRLTWVQQQLASQSPEIDVYQVDAVWAGLLKSHLVSLNNILSEDEKQLYHPKLLANNTVNGDLMALPWYVDIGLLIYRKDLLEKYGIAVPQTWEELEEAATVIQEKERAAGNPKIWGFVFSGKAFEGLTCVVNEWVSSHPDGVLIDANGAVKVNSPHTTSILSRIANWIDKIVPPGALNYAEEDNRGVFQSGNAVFIRHWPYVISLAEAEESPIKGKIGVAPLPKGTINGHHAGTLGGWQLALSKYSQKKEDAIDLIKFLTGEQELKARALRGGYYPPMPHLYQDPEVQASLPEANMLLVVLNNVAPRPSAHTGMKYNQVSSAIWNTSHKILLKKEKADHALKCLEKQLNFMSKNGTKW